MNLDEPDIARDCSHHHGNIHPDMDANVAPNHAGDTMIEAVPEAMLPDSHPGRAGIQGNPTVTLVKDRGRFGPVPGSRLVNNLSWAVGFMELANAGDFAANVWNDVPVPAVAVVFMAVGGTVAAVLSGFAFFDAGLACRNVGFLRRQRRLQTAERARRLLRAGPVLDMDVYMAVTLRELGSEVSARWFMDLLLGCGAVLIAAGTYMAIAGANGGVWLASNILSGYLGNAPVVLYGLVSFAWALYIFCKAQGHVTATRKVLRGSRAAALVKRRSRHVQVFCVINGTATVLGGVGSMMTATMWWGYVVLVPVIASSLFCNVWWRRRVGYTRSAPDDFPPLDPSCLVRDLEFAARAEVTIREHRTSPMRQFVADPSSLPDVLAFLQQHGLLDLYCLKIMSTDALCSALGGNQSDEVNLGVDGLLAVPEPLHARLLEAAQECLGEFGLEHFKNRERYAAELLGTYYTIASNVDFYGNMTQEK